MFFKEYNVYTTLYIMLKTRNFNNKFELIILSTDLTFSLFSLNKDPHILILLFNNFLSNKIIMNSCLLNINCIIGQYFNINYIINHLLIMNTF